MSRSNNVPNTWKIAVAAVAILAANVIPISRAQEGAQESPQARYNKAVRLFNGDERGAAERACDIATQLVQDEPGNSDYQRAANSFCAQAKHMLAEERRLFNEGRSLATQGNCSAAKLDYNQMSTSLKTRDSTYRDQLLTAVQSCETRVAAQRRSQEEQSQTNSSSQSSRHGHDGTTSEDTLRAGIRAYFSGDLATAEDDFTRYLSNPGDRRALAYFFRGATRCSRFYLSGETDLDLKKGAIDDFNVVHQQYSTFKPPIQFFSPKVMELYQAQ